MLTFSNNSQKQLFLGLLLLNESNHTFLLLSSKKSKKNMIANI